MLDELCQRLLKIGYYFEIDVTGLSLSAPRAGTLYFQTSTPLGLGGRIVKQGSNTVLTGPLGATKIGY